MRRLLLLAALASCAHPVSPPRSAVAASVPPKEQASIDASLRDAWRRESIVPAARADDATFLRRAYLDIVGTIPPPDVTLEFLADGSPDKRARLVDTLLASSAYAEHWANYWDDVLMGTAKSKYVDREAFRDWLKARFAEGAPWNRIVSELVAATGQNGAHDEDDPASVNGAVNWTLRFEQTPQDFGGSASRIFLGVQIQCAQCHDHKTEAWKQDDFRRFSSAFLHAKIEPIDPRKAMGGNVPRASLVDAANAPSRFAKNADTGPIVRAKPTALDGTDLDKGTSTRAALATWMTAKENPWFAKAFVNRMWGHFLGRGFYDPIDDIRPSNPAMLPELLDRLTADFVAHGFDVRHLVRKITTTEAYHLAATGNGGRFWSSFHLVPLGPEELLNAVFRATAVESAAEKAGIRDLDALRANVVRQYGFLFDTDEETEQPDYAGTVTQALALLNGALVGQGSRALPGSAVYDLANAPGTDADKVDALAIRALTRHATADERARWVAYVTRERTTTSKGASVAKGPLGRLANKRAKTTPKEEAYEDLLWTLLNSSEFTFNH